MLKLLLYIGEESVLCQLPLSSGQSPLSPGNNKENERIECEKL